MRLFTRLSIKITLILFIHHSDGFMFGGWLRNTKEQNSSTVGQYKHQTYGANEANAAGAATSVTTTPNRFEPKKDSGKGNANGAIAPSTAFNKPPTDKDVIAAYNNQRTGISAPTKYDKHWNGFDAVVVPSAWASVPAPVPAPPSAPAVPVSLSPISYVPIPALNFPYFYYEDETKAAQQVQNLFAYATTPAPPKSVQVELNYKDDTVVEKIGENVVLNRKLPPAATLNSVQFSTESSASNATVTASATTNSSFAIATAATSSSDHDSSSKFNSVQNRPIRLLGSNTVYTAPANWTLMPQLYYVPAAAAAAAAANVRYVSYPFLRSPLMTPFAYKNVPRAVFERSENLPAYPKPEKLFCQNCILSPPPPPSALPAYAHTLRISDIKGNANVLQKPCAQENAPASASASVAATPTSNAPIPPAFKFPTWFTH